MFRLSFLLASLLLPLYTTAQNFQKVTFHQRRTTHTDELVAGQQVKLFILQKEEYAKQVNGRLQEVRNDSIFLRRNRETLGVPLDQVVAIRYRPVSAKRFILTLLLGGIVLLFLFLVLGVAWLNNTRGTSGNGLAVLAGIGFGLILLAPIVALFSNKRIEKPAANTTIEIRVTTPPEAVHIP